VNTTITSALLAGCGILLIAGLWTPVAGTLVALVEISQIPRAGDLWLVPLLLGSIGAALAMLGPGLWSVDARLFGWKRIEAPPRKSSSNTF
jgi:putative oxidoreductase